MKRYAKGDDGSYVQIRQKVKNFYFSTVGRISWAFLEIKVMFNKRFKYVTEDKRNGTTKGKKISWGARWGFQRLILWSGQKSKDVHQ